MQDAERPAASKKTVYHNSCYWPLDVLNIGSAGKICNFGSIFGLRDKVKLNDRGGRSPVRGVSQRELWRLG